MNVAADRNETKKRPVRWRLVFAWMALATFDLSILAMVCGQDSQEESAVAKTVVVEIDGPGDVKADEDHFAAVDVFVDSGPEALAAYQLEVMSRTPGVVIVGIEGGEHTAFSDPPYFDRKAMQLNRVVIAAFNTGELLPAGRSRVARIHLMLRGPGVTQYETKLSVSATRDGKRIPASATVAKADANGRA